MRTIVAVAALFFGLYLLISPPPGAPSLLFKLGMTGFFVIAFAADFLEARAERGDQDNDEDGAS